RRCGRICAGGICSRPLPNTRTASAATAASRSTKPTSRGLEETCVAQASSPVHVHRRKMTRVLTAAVLIPLVLLAVFRAPLWLYALLVAVIIFLALREYLAIAQAAGMMVFSGLTYAVALAPIAVFLIS